MTTKISINDTEQVMGAITMLREQDTPIAAGQSAGVSPDAARQQSGGVGVIGAGHVGASVANALALLGVTTRVVLYDRQLARAEGEAWDIADGTPLLRRVEVVATDEWQGLSAVEVVVVTVGALLRPGQSRLDERNGDLIRAVIERLDAVAPTAVVVIVSNPVDVMTRIAQEASSRPWQLILGTGTVLDTVRLRHELSKLLGVDPQNAHVHVIGEHGDSSFPTWSSAMVGPVPLARFPLSGLDDLATIRAQSAEFTRRRGLAVAGRKGHTDAAIAVAVSRIVESVLRDQRRIYTVSTRPLEDYGVGETTVLSIPCILGRRGVVRRLPLALDHAEQEMLTRSAAILEAAYRGHAPRGPHGHHLGATHALGRLHEQGRKTG